MKIEDDKKVEILRDALKERYESMHKIRERVQNIGLWAIGLLIPIVGWTLTTTEILTCNQKTLLIIGTIIGFCIIRFKYLEDLHIGFKGQQKMAVKIEKTLGFYDKNSFNEDGESFYPNTWEKAGSEEGGGMFFKTTYLMIYFAIAIFVGVVLFQSNSFSKNYHSRLHGSTIPFYR